MQRKNMDVLMALAWISGPMLPMSELTDQLIKGVEAQRDEGAALRVGARLNGGVLRTIWQPDNFDEYIRRGCFAATIGRLYLYLFLSRNHLNKPF